jgi:hypothetical protein
MLVYTGGATIWVNDIHVDSATTYTIKVGAGGQGFAQSGGASSFSLSDAWSVVARGGAPGAHHVGGQGGGYAVEGPSASSLTWIGGGNGGRGGDASWNNHTQEDVAGAGGGAGGYEGGWEACGDGPGYALCCLRHCHQGNGPRYALCCLHHCFHTLGA